MTEDAAADNLYGCSFVYGTDPVNAANNSFEAWPGVVVASRNLGVTLLSMLLLLLAITLSSIDAIFCRFSDGRVNESLAVVEARFRFLMMSEAGDATMVGAAVAETELALAWITGLLPPPMP